MSDPIFPLLPPPVSPAFCSSTAASFSPPPTSSFNASLRLNHPHVPELLTHCLTFSFSNKPSFVPEQFSPLTYPAPLGKSLYSSGLPLHGTPSRKLSLTFLISNLQECGAPSIALTTLLLIRPEFSKGRDHSLLCPLCFPSSF